MTKLQKRATSGRNLFNEPNYYSGKDGKTHSRTALETFQAKGWKVFHDDHGRLVIRTQA